MSSIRPCVYPRCDNSHGDPELTNEGMCRRCQNRYQQTLRWLVLDWVNLRTNMPQPRRRENTERRTTGKIYGHPAEWASDTAAEIATVLNWAHDDIADHLGETPPPHPGTTETIRIRKAWQYLNNRIPILANYPGNKDTAETITDLHQRIRSQLGHTRPRQILPIPCPQCELRTIVRTIAPYNDAVTCDNCGWTIREENYPFFTRLVLDTILDAENTPATNT